MTDAIATTMAEWHEEKRIPITDTIGREAFRIESIAIVAPDAATSMQFEYGYQAYYAWWQSAIRQFCVAIRLTANYWNWWEQPQRLFQHHFDVWHCR